MLSQLNHDNIAEMKNKLIKYTKLIALSFDKDEDLSCDQIDKIYELVERLKSEHHYDSFGASLTENFEEAFDILSTSVINNGFVEDMIELTLDFLKLIGGGARGHKLLLQINGNPGSLHNQETFFQLRKEFYKQIDLKSSEGYYQRIFLIRGLVQSVDLELESRLRQHGSVLISLLEGTNTTEDFNNVRSWHNQWFDKNYVKELQRRIYLWDKLTIKLKNEFSIEELLSSDIDSKS